MNTTANVTDVDPFALYFAARDRVDKAIETDPVNAHELELESLKRLLAAMRWSLDGGDYEAILENIRLEMREVDELAKASHSAE